jgi:SAM-dependent methyltransferase
VKLNLGCGRDVRDGWVNVDILALADGVTLADLKQRWPWEDDSADEAHCSHFIEHLTSVQRCHFWNELHRVLKPGAKAAIIVPHWGSGRAYGDPTHQWPPVSEMHFYYLSKDWREREAPHTHELLRCDFEVTWGYGLAPALLSRNPEFQQFALNHYREAAWDIHATVTKR